VSTTFQGFLSPKNIQKPPLLSSTFFATKKPRNSSFKEEILGKIQVIRVFG
jgi:hypothetical protein